MSGTNVNKWIMENKDTYEYCLRVQTKKHRAMDGITFLEKCNQLKILPIYQNHIYERRGLALQK